MNSSNHNFANLPAAPASCLGSTLQNLTNTVEGIEDTIRAMQSRLGVSAGGSGSAQTKPATPPGLLAQALDLDHRLSNALADMVFVNSSL